MKYILYSARFLALFLILTLPGFSKTMKSSDLIYGKDNLTPQICLSQWDSGVLKILSDHNVDDNKRREVEELIKSFQLKIEKKELKSAYCRFGYIGNDLYFSIKARSNGQSDYSYKDVYLAGNVKPGSEKKKIIQKQEKTAVSVKAKDTAKPVKKIKKEPSEKTAKREIKGNSSETIKQPAAEPQKIDFKEHLLFSASQMPSGIRSIIDIGNGYGIRINMIITGSMLTVQQKNNLQNIVLDVQDNIRAEMLQKVIELAEDVLSCHGPEEMKKVNDLIEEKDKELKLIADEYAISQKLEKAVSDNISEGSNDSAAAGKWSVECNVKISSSSLKITKKGIMRCLTGGTDTESFLALADKAGNINTIISGLLYEEPKLRKEADKTIADFIKDSNRITGMVEDVYINNKEDETVPIKKIIDKTDAAETAERDRFANYLRLKIIGYTTADAEGRKIRLRYKAYLSDTRNRIRAELEKLIEEEQKFKSSMIKKTPGSLPELKKIKKHCSITMNALSDKEAYYDRIEEKLKTLTVTIDEDTKLYTLKAMQSEVNKLKIRETSLRSHSALTKASDEINTGRKTLNDILEILNTGSNIQ